MNIFSTNGPAAQKARRLKVQLLADFLPDTTSGLGLLLHGFGINHFFNDRQVLRQSWRALFAGAFGRTNNRQRNFLRCAGRTLR